jgi:hypothetical protein
MEFELGTLDRDGRYSYHIADSMTEGASAMLMAVLDLWCQQQCRDVYRVSRYPDGIDVEFEDLSDSFQFRVHWGERVSLRKRPTKP